VSAAVCSNV
jgi:hypothetical protein